MTKHINPEQDDRRDRREQFRQDAGLVCRLSRADGGDVRVEIGPDVLGAKPTVTATVSPRGFDDKPPSVGAPWRAVADGNVHGAKELVVDGVNGKCIVDGKVVPILHDRSLAGPIPLPK